ncbi:MULTISPECIES: heterocyst development glycosyltransferase HepC [unclassified Anabaena]|uniref:heterocyst development glycosyltransferase HepC n=1 Tax=unclassified Anabaena TaxID=2619674 RepID=UPI0039C5F55A
MTISLIPALQDSASTTPAKQHNCSPYCSLQWRRGKLLVKLPTQAKQISLPSLNNQQLLVNCLKHSLVNLVIIDPNIGEYGVKLWVEACEQAGKPVFLRIPSSSKLINHSSQLQQLIGWMVALGLLLLMSPMMLALMVLMQIDSPGSLFTYEWYVGERGKLFRAVKFCTTANHNMTALGRWMRKYDLDYLPQLFNVLRGEMSLMGSRSLSLSKAVRLTVEEQQTITGSWEDSELLQLDSPTL